jgi:hypothetical protein
MQAIAEYYDKLGDLAMGPNTPNGYPAPTTAGLPFVPPTTLNDVNPLGFPEGTFSALGLAINVKDSYAFSKAVSDVPTALACDLSRALTPSGNP